MKAWTRINVLAAMVILSACAKQSNEKLDLAHEILSHHASDTKIEIEHSTEKIFEKNTGWFYVCGRAVVNQPGRYHDLVQRFIINVSPEKHGMARYEGTGNGKEEDKEFLDLWADRCDGYALPSVATAASKKSQDAIISAAVTVAPIVPNVTRMNFDTKSTKLSIDFVATDPWEMLALIRKLDIHQDKYENKVNYLARMKTLEDTKLYDDVKLSGNFAFKVSANYIQFSYDPDTEEIKYDIFQSSDGIPIDRRDLNKGEGRSRGGFDPDSMEKYYLEKKFKVVRHEEQLYVENPKSDKGHIISYIGKAKVKPDAAKAIEGKVAIFVVGRIVKPYLVEEDELPFDKSDTVIKYKRKFPFVLNGIWMVNENTGEILSKKITIHKIY